jgi:hypothetical protein
MNAEQAIRKEIATIPAAVKNAEIIPMECDLASFQR